MRYTEIQIAILVWDGFTEREIGKIVGITEQGRQEPSAPCL